VIPCFCWPTGGAATMQPEQGLEEGALSAGLAREQMLGSDEAVLEQKYCGVWETLREVFFHAGVCSITRGPAEASGPWGSQDQVAGSNGEALALRRPGGGWVSQGM